MEVRFQNSAKETEQISTEELRDNFLIENLMMDDDLSVVYSHYDRVIVRTYVPGPYIELENNLKINLRTIIGVNGIFLPEYGEC